MVPPQGGTAGGVSPPPAPPRNRLSSTESEARTLRSRSFLIRHHWIGVAASCGEPFTNDVSRTPPYEDCAPSPAADPSTSAGEDGFTYALPSKAVVLGI